MFWFFDLDFFTFLICFPFYHEVSLHIYKFFFFTFPFYVFLDIFKASYLYGFSIFLSYFQFCFFYTLVYSALLSFSFILQIPVNFYFFFGRYDLWVGYIWRAVIDHPLCCNQTIRRAVIDYPMCCNITSVYYTFTF